MSNASLKGTSMPGHHFKRKQCADLCNQSDEPTTNLLLPVFCIARLFSGMTTPNNQSTKFNGQQVDVNVMRQAVNAWNNITPRHFRRVQQSNTIR